jgi:choline dehydrogenase-like flavoprotein
MSQVIRSPKLYDVCVIGSGAGGGTAAKVLTEGGLNVVLLEAGPPVTPEKDFKMLMWPYELPHRGIGVGGHAGENFGEFLAPNGAWDIEGEPYTSAPGSNFQWFRSRIVGGRTNHWGRIALRFAPIDFKSSTRDGLGDDWPITYDDLAPYYDKVESYIGVFGTRENVSSAPDGMFLPPPKPRCTDLIVKKACDKIGIICIPSRLAILTRSVNGRLACHYCGQCGRGCVTASNFSSSQVMIPPAMKTGKLTMVTGAMAREVLLGKDGKAEGVSYIDKATRTEKRVSARAVVLAASACESARLLLNSTSAQFPNGLANSSGAVGRYLTDSVGSDGWGIIPQLEKMPSPGGSSTARMIFHAAITSNLAAAAKCPASASSVISCTKKKVTAPL